MRRAHVVAVLLMRSLVGETRAESNVAGCPAVPLVLTHEHGSHGVLRTQQEARGLRLAVAGQAAAAQREAAVGPGAAAAWRTRLRSCTGWCCFASSLRRSA